jgi:hypothetical protein
MRRAWGVLALGLGLLAASAGRAGDGPEPVPPPKPLPGPAVNGGAPAGPAVNGGAPAGPALVPNGGAHGGAPCGGCCGPCRSCLEQLVGLFCYRALPVPPCCRQCPFRCHRSCGCMPPPYVFFLGERCHEGHYYGSTCGSCQSCGSCSRCGAQGPGPWPGVLPPPGNTISGVVPPPNLPFSARPQTPLPLPNQGPP